MHTVYGKFEQDILWFLPSMSVKQEVSRTTSFWQKHAIQVLLESLKLVPQLKVKNASLEELNRLMWGSDTFIWWDCCLPSEYSVFLQRHWGSLVWRSATAEENVAVRLLPELTEPPLRLSPPRLRFLQNKQTSSLSMNTDHSSRTNSALPCTWSSSNLT